MKTCKRCHTEKELADFHRHRRMRDGYNIYCRVCMRELCKNLRDKDVEAAREKDRARANRWAANPDNQAKKNARNREWRSNNKHIVNFHSAKRHTDKKNRMPAWLTEEDKKIIQDMYQVASTLTKVTGHEWHVDHVIPLRGKNVSGLHVPYNLQVIPREENIKKHNNYEIK